MEWKKFVMASGIEGILDAILNEKNGYLLDSKNKENFIKKKSKKKILSIILKGNIL